MKSTKTFVRITSALAISLVPIVFLSISGVISNWNIFSIVSLVTCTCAGILVGARLQSKGRLDASLIK